MNWKQRIERAKDTGSFNVVDGILASQWKSCAVGEKLSITNPDPDLPREILEMGTRFSDAVEYDRVIEAEKIYNQIQTIEVPKGGHPV